MNTSAKKLVIGIVLVLIPISKLVYWIIISENSNSLIEAKNTFTNNYPFFLRSNWIHISLLCIAMGLFIKTASRYSILSALLLFLAMALIFLQFWEMM
jgi:hypothetical protein